VVVDTGTIVTHTCGLVTSGGQASKYYASGWNWFTQPSMDLLPGTYTVKFVDKSTAPVTVTAGAVTNIA
jgi:hypothetical protein